MIFHRPTLACALALGCGLLAAAAAQAATRIEKHLPLDPGGRFTLESEVGSVVLRGDSAAGVRVLVSSSRDLEELYEFRFDASPGEVHVSAKRKSRHALFSWGDGLRGRTRFEISVPRRTSVVVRSSGGSVEVADLQGDAELRSSGGSVAAQKIAGALELHASGGSVDLCGIGGSVRFTSSGCSLRASAVEGAMQGEASGGGLELAQVRGDLNVSSSGGSVHIRDAGGRVMADSSGGSVEVAFAPGNGKGGTISSSGGGVRVEVDPGVGLDLSASSSGGGVTCDLPVTVQGKMSRTSIHGVIRGGGEKLVVRSSGGGVHIAPR